MGISGVAFTPAWAVTLFFASPFVLFFLAMINAPDSTVVVSWSQLAFLQLVFVLGQIAWVWSLFEHASERSNIKFRWARSIFAATAIAFPASALLGFVFPGLVLNADMRATRGGIEAVAIDAVILFCVVGFLTCHWYATKALHSAEASRGYRSSSELLTFISMVYLVIGVWSLRSRLELIR